MSFVALSSVRHRVRIGLPLPFGVLDANGQLLLNKGYMLENDDRLSTLCSRGSLVLLEEVEPDTRSRPDRSAQRRSKALEAWAACSNRLSAVLTEAGQPHFRAALDEAATPVLDLIARDPDLAILQSMRRERGGRIQHALRHSIHTAIATRLVAERLGWDVAATVSTFKAALTMNLSVMELQGELAGSRLPPTAEQRRLLREHPVRSRELLELAGVTDGDWLRAVEQHHELEDGSGYPAGRSDVGEKARLIRMADIYCAKLDVRITRQGVMPDRAARELFARDPSNPMMQALVKEFGLYPPGSFVRLASGEAGIVVKRGPTVLAPVVAALTWRSGQPRSEPLRRDTSQPGFKVLKAIGPEEIRVGVSLESLTSIH